MIEISRARQRANENSARLRIVWVQAEVKKLENQMQDKYKDKAKLLECKYKRKFSAVAKER
eukprot:1358157-Amorphochlora_amoeboformis.AAC.3